ncbi:DUF3307 domain-containing protein [Desertivirga brevis]|uniref:DUF3307 domain-containing protein n=1 Tax=Desertivirga brevis TaxID=2810310 RepID=UPI001A968642|nr:DUF3307 domain-containing protein [Pedobacter sp. SYSU D00873]
MNLLLIKLLVAHLIGDFFLQPDRWVIEKEARKLKSPKLYYHILIHGILTILFTWNAGFLVPALLIMLFHGIIDGIKLSFQRPDTKRRWFFADQLFHILTIVIVWYTYEHPSIDFSYFKSDTFWILTLALLFLTYPTSIIIKTLIAKWTPNVPLPASNLTGIGSLESAGKYIGILERLLTFLFITTGHYEAVGFLIAAKSIFRFGDLKEGNDLKFTEYVLIGTLLSFGIAILVGQAITVMLK